ncbi:MAG: OmpH family outer membrane protein [Rhodospirillaceae bacterium]
MITGYRTAIFLCLTLAFAGTAWAQQQPAQAPAGAAEEIPLRVIVLNLEEIRREAAIVKNIRDQIAEFQKSFQAGIQKEEDALRTANQELAKKRTILSPEAFAKERRQFEQRVVAVQQLVQKRKRQLDQAQVDAMFVVEKQLNTIITDIAQKRRASIVLRRSQTILIARDIDVTGEVLARLNKELVKVPVKKPSD